MCKEQIAELIVLHEQHNNDRQESHIYLALVQIIFKRHKQQFINMTSFFRDDWSLQDWIQNGQ